MDTNTKDCKTTRGERFVYDWQYRRLGGFQKILADCISHADLTNQAKLYKGFPEETQAIRDFQNVYDYWTNVKEKIEYNLNKNKLKR